MCVYIMRDKAILFLLATAIILKIFFVVLIFFTLLLLSTVVSSFFFASLRCFSPSSSSSSSSWLFLCDNEFFSFCDAKQNLSRWRKKWILWRFLMGINDRKGFSTDREMLIRNLVFDNLRDSWEIYKIMVNLTKIRRTLSWHIKWLPLSMAFQ